MDETSQLILEAQRFAGVAGGPAADRDDLVQETLLRVWKRQVVRGESGVPSGLIRATLWNVRIDWWRKSRPVVSASSVENRVAGVSPLDDLTWKELRVAVRSAVESLPEPQREVVRLRLYEGMKFKEIAAVQQVPLNTALGRMHQAMKRLRDVLAEHGSRRS